LSNPRLGERLVISESTVKTHVTEIKRKLGVATRAEVIAAYHRTQAR
jgi:DNA-binding NarL/FixJ family response regulator